MREHIPANTRCRVSSSKQRSVFLPEGGLMILGKRPDRGPDPLAGFELSSILGQHAQKDQLQLELIGFSPTSSWKEVMATAKAASQASALQP